MPSLPLDRFPIHLGPAGEAVAQPELTDESWYEDYGRRIADEAGAGRLVSLFSFSENWSNWEMHPAGDEVVLCITGRMILHQELADGRACSIPLEAGEYAINPPGSWHTADASGPVTALFITVGEGTVHRPRDTP